MSGANECRVCGRPSRDAAYYCDACAELLCITLGDVPALVEELEVTITRQKGVDYRRGGGRSTETALAFNSKASDALTTLKAVLVSWVKFCAEENVRNSSPHQGIPVDTFEAITAWLLWRVDGLALLDIGPSAVEEITEAVAAGFRCIDRHPDRQYLGACDMCDEGRLYARPGGVWARCNVCDQATEADKIRERLLGDLDDRLCTAAEIAHLSTYLGLQANRDQVRKRINQWHARNRITPEPAFSGDPVFRFGIVWRLLAHEDREKVG